MKVLVWVAYNTPRVMSAESPADFVAMQEQLEFNLKDCGSHYTKKLEHLKEDLAHCTSQDFAIRIMKNFVSDEVGTYELFEMFSFVDIG